MKIQKEGFTAQPNFTYDFVQSKISPTDWSVFCSIIRILIGWNINKNWISNKIIESKTGLSENTIRTSLKRLQSFNIITISQIVKNGLKHQFIELNLNPDSYIFPIKEKLSEKVKNFFSNKNSQKTKEVYKVESIKITQPPQDLMSLKNKFTASNVEVVQPQNTNFSTSNLEANKHINNNKNHHTHNKKQKNYDNDFKNFSNEELEPLDDNDFYIEENLDEEKNTNSKIEKLLTTKYELNKNFISNWEKIIKIPENVILDEISKLEDLYNQGKIKAKNGKISGLLIKNLTKLSLEIEENNKTKEMNESSDLVNYFKLFEIHQKFAQSYNFLKLQKLTGVSGKSQTEIDLSHDIFRKITLIQDAYKNNLQKDFYVEKIEKGLKEFFIEISKSIGFDNFISFMKNMLGFRKENTKDNLNFIISYYNQQKILL